MLSEFDLIKQYFQRSLPLRAGVALGVGDDCALLQPQAGCQLAISTDMLVSGRHFFADADPFWLGHKSLAVNLSDLAAMAAKPLAFTLALSLPTAEPPWLQAFAAGLFTLADAAGCELIGGDTTRGPLNICITVFGELPPGQALRRDAARVGDEIWVSGSLGDARLALLHLLGEYPLSPQELAAAAPRLHAPQPRLELGLALRGIAHAALDLSDGLHGDLGHILQGSQVGAQLFLPTLPAGPVLAHHPQEMQWRTMLTGGDDYELCFTAPAAAHQAVLKAGAASATAVHCIGRICAEPGLQLLAADGQAVSAASLHLQSFDHFLTP